MPSSKQERANTIIPQILADDKLRGRIDPRIQLPSRMVGDPGGLEARITLDHRFNVAPAYGMTRTERRPIPHRGWRAISIRHRGEEVLSVNVHGSSIHIAFYKPGLWEELFGVDWKDDHARFQWGDAPIGDDLERQLELREKDLQLEPTRGHPRKVDELRTLAMNSPSVRQPQPRPDGPLTVTSQRP